MSSLTLCYYPSNSQSLDLFLTGLLNVTEVRPYGISVTVNCPPDTDTPGLKEEEKYKPEETKLISQSAGLLQPDVVAR